METVPGPRGQGYVPMDLVRDAEGEALPPCSVSHTPETETTLLRLFITLTCGTSLTFETDAAVDLRDFIELIEHSDHPFLTGKDGSGHPTALRLSAVATVHTNGQMETK